MAKRKNKDAQDDPIPELETFGTYEQPDPTLPATDEAEPDGAEYDQLASESDIPDPGLKHEDLREKVSESKRSFSSKRVRKTPGRRWSK